MSNLRKLFAVIAISLIVPQAANASSQAVWSNGEVLTFSAGVQNVNRTGSINFVSCTSVGNCTAVGEFRPATGGSEAFIRTSTGGVWAQAVPATFGTGIQNSTPDATFNSVSCSAPGECTAVGKFKNATGGYEAFTQTSSGGVWAPAVPSTFGTGIQSTPRLANLLAVSCASAGNCTAAGVFRNATGGREAFTQTSSGGVWAQATRATFGAGIQNSYAGAEFADISCASAGECTAVGYFTNTSGGLEAFSQTSTGGVWAQAIPSTFGTGVQNTSPNAALLSVACPSASNCTTGGYFVDASGGIVAFTQTSTNGTWSQPTAVSFAQGVQNPSVSAVIRSISCPTFNNCTAAGYFSNISGGNEGFTVSSSNGVWSSAQPSLFASGVQDTTAAASAWLLSVSCATMGNCTAVGRFSNMAGGLEAFSQTSINGVWAQAIPATFTSGFADPIGSAWFNSVSCPTAGNCTAGGKVQNISGFYEGFSQSLTTSIAASTTTSSIAPAAVTTTTAAPNTTQTTVASQPSTKLLPQTGSSLSVLPLLLVLMGLSFAQLARTRRNQFGTQRK